MELRGDRECTQCGTRWSYFETGAVECPDCGSLRSVGVTERKQHTNSPVTLDLSGVRNQLDDAPFDDVADNAADQCRSYVRQRGFLDAGELLPLDDRFHAAAELVHAAAAVRQTMRPSDDEESYVLALLAGADRGERPSPDDVPESMRAVRGLAAVAAEDKYHDDVRTYLDKNPDEPARSTLSSLDEHRKRMAALDGDVPLATSEGLVSAARALGHYLRSDEERSLVRTRRHLDALSRLP
ncbi:MAG: TFIIB-type zinc ribbon-containing protein [Halorientalis sp.]